MSNRIFVYGLSDTDDIMRKTSFRSNEISDVGLEKLARTWKATEGCSRVFRILQSDDLRDSWFDYIKTRYSRNGLAAFAKLVLVDLIEKEGTELAKD